MEIVNTDMAPKAIGPYSQAVKANGFIFCSGQIALNSEGNLIEGSVSEQTEQIMENLSSVLMEAGSSLEKIVKTTIFLTDMNDFSAVNEIYSNYFSENHKPARATVGVNSLPKGVKVEIECTAIA